MTRIFLSYETSAGQLNARTRLGLFLGFEEKRVLINSFMYANFNYYPLVWHFCSSKSLNKIENIQKRALRYLHNDCISDYDNLKKSEQCTVEVKRLGILALEIFKVINKQSPSFMKELFNMRKGTYKRKNDRTIPARKTVTYGDKGIKNIEPHYMEHSARKNEN